MPSNELIGYEWQDDITRQFFHCWRADVDTAAAYLHGVFTYQETGDGNYRFLREQYTGLKDRNWVDIYEGDIVWLQGMKETFVGPVVFDPNKGFRAKIPGKEAKPRHKYAEPGFVFHLKNCKVIGNIHQNPELLK